MKMRRSLDFAHKKFRLCVSTAVIFRDTLAFSTKIGADKSIWPFFFARYLNCVWCSYQSTNCHARNTKWPETNCHEPVHFYYLFAYIYLRHLFLHHSRHWYISRAMYQQFIGTKNFAKFCHFFFFFLINISVASWYLDSHHFSFEPF